MCRQPFRYIIWYIAPLVGGMTSRMFHCRMGLGTSLLEKEDSVSLLVGPHRGEGEGIGR